MKAGMKRMGMREIERAVLLTAGASLLFFAAGYFVSRVFFYCFLVAILAFAVLLVGYWKCPHCGKRLWLHFDAPCLHCGQDIHGEEEDEGRKRTENPGFFHW